MSGRDRREQSCPPTGTPEDGDDEASDETERPFKKARFAWQVKGKYHLRQAGPSAHAEGAGAAGAAVAAAAAGSAEHNLEILGDYLLKQDLSSAEAEEEAPPSQVVRARHSAVERCVEAWQARQVAKGFVDNTINRVLDSWQAPRSLAARVAALTDLPAALTDLPAATSVEDQGILAAISAHGLHHHRTTRSVEQTAISAATAERSRRAEACDGGRARGGLCCHTPRPSRAPPAAPELATFMDAAVEFAIQHKGLTALGYEYG